MTMTPKQVRNLLIGLTVLIAAIVIYIPVSHINTKVVILSVAPGSASVTIDGDSVSKSKVRLHYGEHNIKATLKNFNDVEKKFTVDKNSDPNVRIVLDAANDAGTKYLSDDPNQQSQREAIASDQVNKQNILAAQKYPFLDQLPLERQKFTINYGDTVNTKKTNPDEPYVALYVDMTDPTQKRNALRTIREDLGIDPSDIEIIYQDYFNPFNKAAYDE